MAGGYLTMEQFFMSVERRAFRMAQIATGDSEEALDIVQDAMLNMVKQYAAKPENLWKPLFYRILQNRIRDWYRRMKVRRRWRVWLGRSADDDLANQDPLANIADTGAKTPDECAELGDIQKMLDQAIRSLPVRQQQAFMLRAWEEMSVAETARSMGCSQGSVKTHYSRAVRALRERLEGLWP